GEVAAGAAPALTGALADKDVNVRLAAAKALWAVTQEAGAVVPALVALLGRKGNTAPEDGEARRRFLQTAIEALWRIGPPAAAAVPALRGAAGDKNRHVSECARRALER